MERDRRRLLIEFSTIVRTRRQELGLTQWQVAEIANLSWRGYQDIERGARLPSLPTALKLCAVLDFSLDSLREIDRL